MSRSLFRGRTGFWVFLAVVVWTLSACFLFFSHCWVPWKYVPALFDVSFLPPVDWATRLQRWGLLARGPLVGFAAVLVLLYWGGRIRRWMGFSDMDPALRLGFDFALGGLFLNLFWVGTGLTGLWRDPLVSVSLLVLGVPAFAFLKGGGSSAWRTGGGPLISWRGHGVAGNILFVLGLCYLALVFVHSLVPDMFVDSNTCNLALPNLWKRLGGMVPVPGMLYTQWPFGGECVLLNGFWFASDEAAKAVNVAVLGALGLVFYGWAREEAGPKAAAFTAGCLWTFPLLDLNVWNVQVECLLTLYLALCLYAFRRLLEDPSAGRRALWLSFCLFGAGAFAVKYVAVLPLGAVGAVWLVLRRKVRFSASWKDWGWALVVFGLVGGPWFIRNAAWTGNPFAPYFSAWFGGDSLSAFGRTRLLLEQGFMVDRGGWAFLTWPLDRMTHMADIADFAGPFALVFLPLVLFLRPPGPAWRMIFFGWILALAGGSFVTHVLRFHAPTLALGFLMAAVCLARQKKTWVLTLATAAASVSAVMVMPMMSDFSAVHYSWVGMVSGRESRPAYLLRAGETPYGTLAGEVGELTPPDARVLLVGDARTLHYPRTTFAQSVFDEQMLVRWTLSGGGDDFVWRGLKRMGIDDVVVSGREAARRGRDYALFDLSPDRWRRLDASLGAALEPVTLDKWGGLYKVRATNDPDARAVAGWPRPFQLLSPHGALFVQAYQAGRWDEAEKDLDALIAGFPGEGYWYEQRARVRMKRGDQKGACADLGSAERYGAVHSESLELRRRWGCFRSAERTRSE